MSRLNERDTKDPYLIAEIGSNHNRDFEATKRLVELIADVGFEAVKFQLFTGSDIAADRVPADAYGVAPWNAGKSSWPAVLDSIALPQDWLPALVKLGHDCGLDVVVTPEHPRHIEWLVESGVDCLKSASMDLDFLELHEGLIAAGMPVIVSTGMSTLDEIDRVVELYTRSGASLTLLHCVSMYPTTEGDALLSFMRAMSERYADLEIGLSDHSVGNWTSCIAAYLGARFFEKHVTLDRTAPGPDHHFSLDPQGMQDFVTSIRAGIELSNDQPGERPDFEMRPRFRRSAHAARPIGAGSVIERSDIHFVRPGDGISPWDVSTIVGRESKVALGEGEPVLLEYLT